MIPGTMASSEALNRQWWKADEGKEHERVMPLVSRLRMQDSDRRETVLRHIKMYGGLGPSLTPYKSRPDKLRYNVCEQGVDTLLAEITSAKPKATFLTTGGNWMLRQGAKETELLIEAQMREEKIYDGKGRQVQRDAEVCGVGFVEVMVDWEALTPKLDRCLPFEVMVDEADARYGSPRGIFRQHLMDRGVLLEKCGDTPERRKAIEEAPRFSASSSPDEWLMSNSEWNESDLVLVVKGWRMPSSRRAKDGKHVLCIDGCTLHSSAFTRDHFPLIKLAWSDDIVGYWSKSVVSQLEADQVEINRTLRRIQEAAGVAAGYWLMQTGSKVRQDHLTDVPGAHLFYTGVKPEYVVPATLPGDLVNHVNFLIQRALQRIGVSEMFANAQKPAGLNSGEAQRVHANVFSQRQIAHVQAYESWHVDIARGFLDANEDIADYVNGEKDDQKRKSMPDVNVSVMRGRRTVLKRLRFDKARLPENQWVIQAYPMSSLPSEPSGRQATVGDWISLGLIDATEARALMNMPDLESSNDLKLADYDFALWAFETMVYDNEYVSPEPFQKLELGLELVRVSYLRGLIDGVPDDRLDLVRDHMSAIKRLIQKATQPPPMAAMPPAGVDAGLPPDAALAAVPAPELAGIDPSTLPVAA